MLGAGRGMKRAYCARHAVARAVCVARAHGEEAGVVALLNDDECQLQAGPSGSV